MARSESESSCDYEPRSSQKKKKQTKKSVPPLKPLKKGQSSGSQRSSEDEPYAELSNKKRTCIQKKLSPIQKRHSSESESSSDKQQKVANKKSGEMSWTELLQENYPKYQKQNLNLKLPENAKYELLLVPKNIEPQSLINLKLHLNKSTLNILNGKGYIFEPLPHKPDPVLINLHKPKLVVLKSVISLQQFVQKLDLQKLKVPEKNNISFPEAIKERHPLFGAEYQKKIKLDDVKKRQKEANIKQREAEEKMKKRKRKKSNKSNTAEEGVLSIFNAEGKQKKKGKEGQMRGMKV